MTYIPWEFMETTQFGDDMETKAREIIMKTYNVEVVEITGRDDYKTKLYDFKTSDGIKYEVKGDRMSSKTDNFFIEYQGYGVPSGISITTADKWMLLYNDSFYLISQSDLYKLVEAETRIKQNKAKNALGKIIRVSDVEPYAVIISFQT